MAFVIVTLRSFVAPFYNYKHHFLCGAAHGRMLHYFRHASIFYFFLRCMLPCLHSFRTLSSASPLLDCFYAVRNIRLGAFAVRAHSVASDLFFFKVGQVVRIGTSHKAPYATWLFVTALALCSNPRAK